tara:strand:+ start:83 stop:355 length:273 start_codon:yes stop_codon:yes gene_type:complete
MNDYCEACDCDPCDCDGMEVQDPTPPSTTYVYIPHGDILYVPRAPSLCEARERGEFLEGKFDKDVMIVGPFEWEILSGKLGWKTIKPDDV